LLTDVQTVSMSMSTYHRCYGINNQCALTSLVRLPDRICPPTDSPWHCK